MSTTDIPDPTFPRILTASSIGSSTASFPATTSRNPYKNLLRAADVGFFDPEFKALEQEHGKIAPGPVVNAVNMRTISTSLSSRIVRIVRTCSRADMALTSWHTLFLYVCEDQLLYDGPPRWTILQRRF